MLCHWLLQCANTVSHLQHNWYQNYTPALHSLNILKFLTLKLQRIQTDILPNLFFFLFFLLLFSLLAVRLGQNQISFPNLVCATGLVSKPYWYFTEDCLNVTWANFQKQSMNKIKTVVTSTSRELTGESPQHQACLPSSQHRLHSAQQHIFCW